MEVDIWSMILNEYLMYKAKQRDLTRSFVSWKRGGWSKVTLVRYQESYFDHSCHDKDEVLEYLDSNEEVDEDEYKNINDSIRKEKEEVHMEDVKMDEDHNVDI
uniref:Uncharacterized protein n=1 Tax=Tanacetum cinerariifolium TaxID=118510 RepID=A0A6L2NBM2_TANCI|nr:hypothetical protein [Tanacetum cinerariifolium]